MWKKKDMNKRKLLLGKRKRLRRTEKEEQEGR